VADINLQQGSSLDYAEYATRILAPLRDYFYICL
jgi:hypothetical protein